MSYDSYDIILTRGVHVLPCGTNNTQVDKSLPRNALDASTESPRKGES